MRGIWPTMFTRTFTSAVRGIAGHLVTDPATLEATLDKSVESLTSALNEYPPGACVAPSWCAIVAARLRQNAGPIFTRAEGPTSDKATAVRLAALCLAGEADGMERNDIGDMFRQLAAGITLLEYRATGKQPPCEVIMLAEEQPPSDAHSNHQKATSGWDSLTFAELRVAALVAEGLSNREIARRLAISPRTAGIHVGHILKKLGVASSAEIARDGALRQLRMASGPGGSGRD